MSEQFKIKVLTTGRPDVDKRRPCNLNPLSLQKLLDWIDLQPTEENIKVELKKSAANYPHDALPGWQRNYEKHVAKIMVKNQKLQQQQLLKEKNEKKAFKIDHFSDLPPISNRLDDLISFPNQSLLDEFEQPVDSSRDPS
jgi:hypothetical protein